MNKFKKISVLSLIAISTVFVGCDNKDDATGASTIKATPNVVGEITLPFTTVQNVDEVDEDTFTFSVTIDQPQIAPIHINVRQISGSATQGEDFEIPEDIVIPAYATTASGTVKILNDCTPEAMEDFTIQIGDITTANASIGNKTLSFTINNNLSNDLDLAFNFNHAFSIAGTNYTLCGIGYDMDYYLLDSSMNDTGNYDAATGDCIETLTLTSGVLADGEYYIYYDIYDDGGISNAYHDPFKVPTTTNYERCGGIDPASFVQESAFVPGSTDGSGSDYVVTIEVNAGVFTLKNSIPEVIASGRQANRIHAAIANARRNNPNKR